MVTLTGKGRRIKTYSGSESCRATSHQIGDLGTLEHLSSHRGPFRWVGYITVVEHQCQSLIKPTQQPFSPRLTSCNSKEQNQDHRAMSSNHSDKPSPSKSQTDRATSKVQIALPQQASTTSTFRSVDSPRAIAGQRSQSTPSIPSINKGSIRPTQISTNPLVAVHNPHPLQPTSQQEPETRQGRSLVARHLRTSFSQSPRRAFHPYARARSQPHSSRMSSASTPSNTSTSGSTSGSNPSYQLPYAPFPYPAPANAGQQGSKGGSGK